MKNYEELKKEIIDSGNPEQVERFEKLESPPEYWHTTDKITPCANKKGEEKSFADGEERCGKTTELMYPIFGKFVCEEHRGTIMGMPLCCSGCFQPYWPSFPERALMCGEKWTGHCANYSGKSCCHRWS